MSALTYGDLEKYQNDPTVFLLSADGGEYSATYGDYFMHFDDEEITDENGDPMLLCRRHATLEVIAGEEVA